MKIAICEDDISICNRIIRQLQTYPYKGEIQCVAAFHSGNQFWFEYQNAPKQFDLIILDIELPGGLNGLEVGRKIRAAGDDAAIVILTSFKKYALDGYEIQPYRYLLKPVETPQLFEVVDHVREKRKRTWSDCLNLYWQGGLERIPFDRILYLESRGHHVYIHVEGEAKPRRYYRKLSDLATLCDRRFAGTHKSYLINMDKIVSIRGAGCEVCLQNGRVIPISHQRKAAFIKDVMDYDRNYGIISVQNDP